MTKRKYVITHLIFVSNLYVKVATINTYLHAITEFQLQNFHPQNLKNEQFYYPCTCSKTKKKNFLHSTSQLSNFLGQMSSQKP